jgi:glutamine synthetase
MCDCLKPNMAPIANNTCAHAAEVMKKVADLVPWFGIEQEYTLFEKDGVTPYGWSKGGYPGPQGPYYCGTGATLRLRTITAACMIALTSPGSTLKLCLASGNTKLDLANEGIASGDYQVWMARYLMLCVCEAFDLVFSVDSKPIPGDWNGAGCHTNVSTEAKLCAKSDLL